MKFHGITLEQGSAVTNMTLDSGTSFPSLPDEGELFFRSDADQTVKGLYLYISGGWLKVANPYAVTIPKGPSLPVAATEGDLFYLDTNSASEGLYLYKAGSWVNLNAIQSYSVTGDVSGTLDGGTDELTLATVNSNVGTFGSATQAGVLAVNAKGLVTSASNVTITPAWSSITSKPTTLSGFGITDAVAKAGDTMSGPLVIDVNTASTALRVTQSGAGNILVVEDSANPDSTPFMIDSEGRVAIGTSTTSAALTTNGKLLFGNKVTDANLANTVNFSLTAGIAAARSLNLVDSEAAIKVSRAHDSNGATIELQQWNALLDTNIGYWDIYSEGGYFGIRDRKTGILKNRIFINADGVVLIGSTSSTAATSASEITGTASDKLQVLGSGIFTGTVSGGTPTAAAHLTTKNYVDTNFGAAQDADIIALAALATAGIAVRTGSGTWATRTLSASGVGLSITNGDGVAGNPTVTSNATSSNTASTIVSRDASGNFSAGIVTASLTGAASLNVLRAGDLMTGALGIITGTVGAPGLYLSGDTNTGLYSPAAETLAISANGVETARFTTSGLLVGLTSTVTGTTAGTAKIQATGVANYLAHYAADSANPPIFTFAKARAGGVAVDSTNGGLGEIRFDGWDGSSWVRSAMIASSVDGTVSTGSVPSLIRFATMPAGGVLLERFRIASTGAWGLSGTSYGNAGQVLTSAGAASPPTWTTPTTGTVTSVAATAPAAGITISGSPITSNGTLTFALANDLSAVESLSSTGFAARTGTDAWAVRTISVSGTGLSITNGDGVSGNPTITSNATSSNTGSTLVSRDASGNFSAGTITATLSGNATTASSISGAPALSQTTTVTAVNNTTQTVVSIVAAASARTAKYMVQVHDTTNSHFHAVEILVIHNGASVWKTEYAEVVSNAALGTFDVDISSGNVRLLFTATATTNKNVTVYRTTIAP